MKSLSSRDNSFFKQLKKLASSARERKKSAKTLLDGVHLIEVYLERVGHPEWLVVAASFQDHAEIRPISARVPEDRLVILDDKLFGNISTVESATGIVAVIAIPEAPPNAGNDFCMLLETIQDPGNLGSILRSAAAAGCDNAYLSLDCVDAWSPKVLRAGMGAHFLLPIREHPNLCDVAKDFAGTVLAASLQAGKSLYECDLGGRLAIVIGNEGAGISDGLLAAVSETARIPMPGGMESLNAAAAAAICLFERVRQRSVAEGTGTLVKRKTH